MSIKKKLKCGIRSVIQMAKEEKLYPVPQPVNAQKILEGKVAMVTGGTGGIGFAMARAFINAGCKVVLCGTKENKVQQYVQKLNSGGVEA